MVAYEGLRGVAFLDGLEDAEFRELADASSVRDVPGGENVFREGDEADGLYLIDAGTVIVYRRDDSGGDVELSTHNAGEIFGELAILEGGRRSASVRAASDARLIVIGREAFLELLARRPTVALNFLAALSRLVRDRSERMLREEAARREVELQAEVDRHRTLTQMVAGVAHELNTPLGTANTAADIIAKRLASESVGRLVEPERDARMAIEDAREAADLLLRNIARAHHLVLSFKQVSVRGSTEAVETVVLARLVEDIVDLFRIDARKTGLTVELIDERADRDARWTGQPGHLTQVVLNLLGNVARYAYAEPGGLAEVRLRDADLDGRAAAAISVRDEGAGIPAEDLSKVFEPFFTTGRGKGGSGLGLAIVRSLVRDALHGTIEITSTPGAGTTATVTVPLAPEDEPAPPVGDAERAPREEVAMA